MWEINNYDQVITFLLSLALGAIFCIFYDIIRAIRQVCLNSFLAVNICDILIWTIYSFVTFIFLISRTSGEIRGYVLFGELCGFGLLRISLSKVLFKILSYIFIKINLIKCKICSILAVIISRIKQYVLKKMKFVAKIFKSAKKVLKSKAKLLYTYKNIVYVEKSSDETKTET